MFVTIALFVFSANFHISLKAAETNEQHGGKNRKQ